MGRNQIVINVDLGETRVAFIEEGVLRELHVERNDERNVVGNVYLGRVTRVLPGMNAAFVDIGLERTAFLHLDDILGEREVRASSEIDDGGSASDEAESPESTAETRPETKPEAKTDGRPPRGTRHADTARKSSAPPKTDNPRPKPEREKSRATPRDIREVVREGQEIVVQVSKGPISTKGARVTSHVSLPGRYVVYVPSDNRIGVSKRIGNDKERKRLREVIEQIKPEKGGVIVRTASEGLTKKQLKTDIAYLLQLWTDIWRKREGSKAPALLSSELDVVLRMVRDLMGPDIEKIVIDDKETFNRCARFIEQFMPDRKDDVVAYTGNEPVFDEYGIEDEITRAISRKVDLKSGGYLIIDEAEALTAIDVNSGRSVGTHDVEETVTQTNLEAVGAIAYQLRLRNLGGLIVLDLIDMERADNREKVHRALAEALKSDKARTSILTISELGLIEMTRKRTRASLGRVLCEPCFYCDGRGHTQSKVTIAHEVLRQIRRERDQLPGYTVVVNAHPAVIDVLKTDIKSMVEEAERRYQRKIVPQPRPEYHIEQFDIQGR